MAVSPLFGTDCANWNSREILNGRRNARFAFMEIRPLYGMVPVFDTDTEVCV